MALVPSLAVDTGPDAVAFTLVVTNTGDEAVELSFRDGLTADFAVTGDGVDWRWSDGRLFTQALRSDRLEPGESHTVTATWDDPRPGEYTVEATLEATDAAAAARTAFEV